MPKGKECSAKMKSCVAQVKARGGDVNPYAVCKASVGKGGGKKK